jgi:hypothetical protein
MAFEQTLAAVSPQAFTADGTTLGVVTVASTAGFYIKQKVNLQLGVDTNQILLQIKNVLSDTQLIVGPNNNSLKSTPQNITNITAYTVIAGATISAPEQNNFPIPDDDHYNTVFMPAPVMADRVIDVDPYGNPYGPNNPYPIIFDGTIDIGKVEIIGPAPDNNPLEVNVDGSINVNLEGLTTFQTSQYTVGTSSVQITPTPMPNRSSIGFKAITTTSTDAIYIGNSSSVTTSTGYPLFNHDTLEMDLEGTDTIYAVGTSTGQILCVVELGD